MKDTLGIILPQVGDDTDLQPLLDHRSVGTLPFGGRYRLIDFTLSNMVNSGITKVGIIGTIKYSSLIDHIGTGKEWLLSRKTNDLSILTGSVNRRLSKNNKINTFDFILNRNFLERSKQDKVLLSSSNIITTYSFNPAYEMLEKNDADAVLIYTRDVDTFGAQKSDIFLTLNGKRVIDINFEDVNDTGICYADMMIIKKKTLMKIIDTSAKSEEFEFMNILKDNTDSLKIYGLEHEGYLNRVFNLEKYYTANMDLLNYDVLKELFLTDQPVYTKTKDNHPTRYGLDSQIKDCIVGSGGYINGEMDHSIAFREVELGENSKIKNSIIMQKCVIGENVELDHVIFDKEVTVRDNSKLIGTKEEPIVLSKGTTI